MLDRGARGGSLLPAQQRVPPLPRPPLPLVPLLPDPRLSKAAHEALGFFLLLFSIFYFIFVIMI